MAHRSWLAHPYLGKTNNWNQHEVTALSPPPKGTRCGDIILAPDTKAGFNAVHDDDAYPGWHGGPSQADSLVPLAIASEALSVEGANPLLRSLIERSKKAGQSNQNQDMTRMVRKLFEEIIK